MFDRVVTISASTPARLHAARTASWRRLSAALGACDMDVGQQPLEGGDSSERSKARLLACGIHDDRGSFVDRRVVRELEYGRFLRRRSKRDGNCRSRRDLALEIGNRLLEIRVMSDERQRRAVLSQRFFKQPLSMKNVVFEYVVSTRISRRSIIPSRSPVHF